MKMSNRILIVALTVAVMIAMISIADFLQPSHIVGLFKPASVQAAQPVSVLAVVTTGSLNIYCEQPSGDKIYVAFNLRSGGVAMWVAPGGCK